MGDVLGTALLIGAIRTRTLGFQGNAQILDTLHRQQGGDHRTLVVVSPAAIDAAVHDLGRVGFRHGPALALVHNVQMTQNVQGGLPVVKVGGAHVALVADGVL